MRSVPFPRLSVRRQEPNPAAASWRALLLAIAVPTLLVAILALEIAYLVDVRAAGRPERLDIFLLLAKLDAPAAGLVIMSVAAALLLARRTSARVAPPALERALRIVGAQPGLVSLCAGAAFLAGAVCVYRSWPLSMDEYSTLFQARAFAAGSLTGRFPPDLLPALVPDAFLSRSPHEILGRFFSASRTSGEIVSVYWPGFALLLTPFVWLGVPWLLNPLLGAALLLTCARLAHRIFPGSTAPAWTMAFLLGSPTFMAQSISFYAMNALLLANALFALLLVRPTAPRALAAGLVGSIALTLHVPYPHLLFALPWIGAVARAPRRRRLLLALGTGYAPLTLALGVGWILVRARVSGSSPGSGSDAPVTLAGAAQFIVDMARATLVRPNSDVAVVRLLELVRLCMWTVPGLPFLALVAYREYRTKPAVRLLAWSIATCVVGYLFVPVHQGHGWGSRYLYPAWLAFPVLSAGLVAGSVPSSPLRTFAVLATGTSLALANPLRAYQIRSFIDHHLAQLPPITRSHRQLMVLDLASGYYVGDLLQNDPFLRGTLVRVQSRGAAADRELIQRHFPGARLTASKGRHTVWTLPDTRPPARPSGADRPAPARGRRPASPRR